MPGGMELFDNIRALRRLSTAESGGEHSLLADSVSNSREVQQIPGGPTMSRLSRRHFIKSSLAAAGAGVLINGTKATGNFFGANETIRIGVAGINGRGGAHISEWAKMDDVKIAYLIDPDTRLFKMRAKTQIKDGADEPRSEEHTSELQSRPHL